jgi:hypothetical protein
MKLLIILVLVVMLQMGVATAAVARDFDWFDNLSVQAEADPSGFRARLAARFKIGDVQVKAVLSNVNKPADAYMVLRLGEMSRRPTEYVIAEYRSNKGKGWGALAKSLGIKPGSREFHALKRGHDLYDGSGKDKGRGQSRGKSKSKGKGKGK